MNIESLIEEGESLLKEEYLKIDELELFYSHKIISLFQEFKIDDNSLRDISGYGYDDFGRINIEKIYAKLFNKEASLVRSNLVSGTNTIMTSLMAILRPNDVMLSISGKLYDTLDLNPLKEFKINYEEIDLLNNDFDYNQIVKRLKQSFVKIIYVQRSKGYSYRDSITCKKVNKLYNLIKEISKGTIIVIDNCYCELVSKDILLGDLIIGSLIKNIGGGEVSSGGYIVGNKTLIELCEKRLNTHLGLSPCNHNKEILKGLYMAPSVVASSLKLSLLASFIMAKLGYETNPKLNEERADIVLAIKFNNEAKLKSFIEGIQEGGAINSTYKPIPDDMPGYQDKIIMASPSFILGSSIEISCDGPLKKPYIAYLQGGLTYNYAKLALIKALKRIEQ